MKTETKKEICDVCEDKLKCDKDPLMIQICEEEYAEGKGKKQE